jgi:1-phosphatidylinositol phosphodiesterase
MKFCHFLKSLFFLLCLISALITSRNHNKSSKKFNRFNKFGVKTTTDCFSNETPKLKNDVLNTSQWMKNINDDTKLFSLSIPGTHDSCTQNFENSLIIRQYYVCQYWSIEEQLWAGIRYLDIRGGDDGKVYHTSSATTLDLKTVLDNVKTFLQKYPSETVIMRIKYENGSSEANFVKYWDNLIKDRKQEFEFLPYNPTLGQVRGKIYPLYNFSGYSYAVQNYGNSIIKKQDNYELKSFVYGISDKKKSIQDFINANKGNQNSGNLYINHCSATPVLYVGYSTEMVAKETNCVPLQYTGFLGITVFDFPSEKAVLHVIQQNTFETSKSSKKRRIKRK